MVSYQMFHYNLLNKMINKNKSITLYHYSKIPLSNIKSGYVLNNNKGSGRFSNVTKLYSNQYINFFTFPIENNIRLLRNKFSTIKSKGNPAWTSGTWYEHTVIIDINTPYWIVELSLITTNIADDFPVNGVTEDYIKWWEKHDLIQGNVGNDIIQLKNIIDNQINKKNYTEWMKESINVGLDINPDQYSGGVPHIGLAIDYIKPISIKKITIL